MPARLSQLQIRVSEAQKRRLRRLAADAGMDMSAYVLDRVLPSGAVDFERLVARLATAPQQSYVWAALHDLLQSLAAADFEPVTGSPRIARLPPVEAIVLAAMVEHSAASKGVAAPAWTMAVVPLDRPWFGTSLKSARIRLHLLQASPAAYKRRNIFVDSAVGDRV